MAQVVAPTERGGRVEIGSHVTLDEDGEETVALQVVGSAEANSREGRISSNSPVGAALMGRRVGDAVTIVTPGGEIHYRILEIARPASCSATVLGGRDPAPHPAGNETARNGRLGPSAGPSLMTSSLPTRSMRDHDHTPSTIDT